MSAATADKYVAKRAELLAELVLTRRKGVRVSPFPEERDTGIRLVAQIPPTSKLDPHEEFHPFLCVQVKGTDEPLEDERSANVACKKHWKPLSLLVAPAVFLIFSMEGDQGYYSWMLEPHVDHEEGPTLTWIESPDMSKITKKSIEDVFDRTEAWFKATSGVLLREKSDR